MSGGGWRRRSFRFPWRTRAQIGSAVDEEIGFHLEMRVDALMAEGLDEASARAVAVREFGDVDAAGAALRQADLRLERERRRADRLDRLGQDVRFATRTLRRSPGFAAAAVSILAVGIAATTSIFSVVDSVLLRPLPYAEPDRLVVVEGGMSVRGEFEVLRESGVFESIAMYNPYQEHTITGEGEPIRVSGAAVSPAFFALLGVDPVLGRAFQPAATAEDEQGVVLSYGLWRRAFGSDPGVVGRSLTVDGESRRVLGVLPGGFHFHDPATEVWLPVERPQAPADAWGSGGYLRVARLAAGADLADTRAEVAALGPRLRELVPWRMPDDYWAAPAVVSLKERMVGESRPMLLVLFGGVALVLLIACVNLANLLLARAAARGREMAVRGALGADRRRLIRQLLTESLVLAGAGGGLGITLAVFGVRGLTAILPPELPRVSEVSLDPRVLGFALAVTALTGLLFGSAPALRATRADLNLALREGGRSGAGRGRQRLTASLVVAQIALAVLLVVGAGLLIRSYGELVAVDPGFEPRGAVAATIAPPEHRYAGAEAREQLYLRLLRRLDALPLAGAAVADRLPFGGRNYGSVFVVEGRPDPATEGGEWPWADVRAAVSDGYLRTLGIPLLEGRAFEASDRRGSAPVAMVTRALAESYWPGESPIGKRIRFPGDRDWRTIVGVTGDPVWDTLDEERKIALFVPILQDPAGGPVFLLARPAAGAASFAPTLRALVRDVDPEIAIAEVRPLPALLSASLTGQRSTTLLLSAFAAAALFLGALGVYGIVSYAVTQRTREIGVRLALGARPVDVRRLVVRHGFLLTAAGLLIGLAAAAALARSIESLLFGVRALDLLTFAVVPFVLTGIALLASYLPARRATAVDPMQVLRSD